MRKTKWFPGDTRPVHVGVYETAPSLDGKQQWFQHWNGQFWSLAKGTILEAEAHAGIYSMHQWDEWRGLSGEPK